jgi:hypothetical protein
MSDTRTGPGRARFFGKYRGVVTSNTDPLNLARVTATVPSVLDDLETGWALPCVPYAGDGSGFHAIPPVGAGVWIEFEGGDVDYPIWTGGWWGDGQVPSDQDGNVAGPPLKILRSEQGLMVALDDDGQTVTLSDSGGDNIVTIKVVEGEVRIEATRMTVIESPLIQLVDRSTHPVVFGDLLLSYLNQLVALYNSHLHVGETVAGMIPVTPAPPAMIFPPADPSLISTRVTSG